MLQYTDADIMQMFLMGTKLHDYSGPCQDCGLTHVHKQKPAKRYKIDWDELLWFWETHVPIKFLQYQQKQREEKQHIHKQHKPNRGNYHHHHYASVYR